SWWLSFFFFSSRRRHTRFSRDWSSDVCSSDLASSFDADSRGWARIFSGLRAAVLAFLGFAGAWCGAFPGGLGAWRVAPLAFVSEIGRASCRERVWTHGGARSVEECKSCQTPLR